MKLVVLLPTVRDARLPAGSNWYLIQAGVGSVDTGGEAGVDSTFLRAPTTLGMASAAASQPVTPKSAGIIWANLARKAVKAWRESRVAAAVLLG